MYTHILHDTNGLLRLPHELILSLLNLSPRLLTNLLLHAIFPAGLARQRESTTLSISLRSIQAQPRVLHRLAGPRRKHNIRVQRRTPARQKSALDLGILCEPSLSDLLAGNSELLEGGRERVFAGTGMLTGQNVRAVQGGTGNGVAEGLGLRLRGGRCGEGGLGFGGRSRGGQEVDFLGDGAAEIVEGLADVGGIVVGFVRVLRAIQQDVSVIRTFSEIGGAEATYVTCSIVECTFFRASTRFSSSM